MTIYLRGTNAVLTVQWYEFAGGPPANVTAQTITIRRVSDLVNVVGPTAVGIVQIATGLYAFTWTVPPAEVLGDYAVIWNATDAQFDAVQTSEIITVQIASASGGCAWAIEPLICCTEWETFSATVRAAALDYATAVMWSATGRRFGACPVTVRPCGRYTRGGVPSLFGYTFSLYGPGGAAWYPYIGDDGLWRNCACPATNCGCRPDFEVYLPGPVLSVTEVIQDGLVVPKSVLNAAGILACEYAKACVGGNCRLPASVQSIARQGVNVQFLDFGMLVERGFTGITEVDSIIRAFNPYGLKSRLKVWSPEIKTPRMTTSA